MGRHSGSKHSGAKPQARRTNSGSRGSRQRNQSHSRVFGDTPIPEIVRPQNTNPTSNYEAQSLPKWMSIFRAPSSEEADRITTFIEKHSGKNLGIHRHLRHSVVAPNIAKMVLGRYEASEADRLIEEYLAAHSSPVPYEVFRLFSFRGRTEILLGANPTDTTKSALNQDVEDFVSTFGIDPSYRHRSLVLGAFPDQHACNKALDSLTETLQGQGGVLLTFSGLQTPNF